MSRTANIGTDEAAARLDWRGIIGAALGAVALLTAVLAAFAWPTGDLEPRALPLAVAASSAEATATVENQLATAFGEDGIEVIEVTDRDAAVAAIEHRKVYGAIVVGPDGAEVLTAAAASTVVAQLLSQTAQGMAVRQGSPPASVTGVAPTTDGDPRGAIFSAGALPLALGGLLVGAISSLLLGRIRDRIAAAFLASAGAGLALTGALQGWFDALSGSYWANASVIALGVLAVALPVIGLHRLLDRLGIGIVAVLVMLVGNPLSGVTSAPELLPLGWLGQLLPPGATGTALRGTAYFDGAGIGPPLVVLLCWAGAGLALALAPGKESTDQPGQESSRTRLSTPSTGEAAR
ncbi:hypothetical protein DQP55_18365 [Mycolicibacterium sp. GF69]|uniref:hypothetical protein n=1 Tax=Mycolicibacterium sp. GF69 TaxID=2267251 RepID=UPI000DCF1C22|nr:hypothetical protein [Mycolicibacterium sp. GF69]RAV08935.1 hypothetical protein DQP55_18365 [Mycolicibacterium sp. GF69]